MYYAGPDRLDVFHHTASTPLAHLRHLGDREEGWYAIRQSGCLVSVVGPFPSAEAAREAGADKMAHPNARRNPAFDKAISPIEGPEGHAAPLGWDE